MKVKKVVCLICSLILVLSITACDKVEQKSAEQLSVETAVTGLTNLQSDYIISTVMEMPENNVCYIESVTADGVYTEYPLSADGSYSPVAFEDANNTKYYLTDWLTKDSKMYIVDSRYEQGQSDNMWIQMPDSYAKDVGNRSTMYLNWIVPSLTDITAGDAIDTDLGAGTVTMTIYKAKMPADIVKKVCGVDTLGLYKDIETETEDPNTVSLLNRYIKELDMSLTFSDANVVIGVYDGAVRYLQIQAGGLGSVMYYTKTILVQNFEHRDKPDFSGASLYMDNVKSLADHVAKYPTYEEAIAALNTPTETPSEETTNTSS